VCRAVTWKYINFSEAGLFDRAGPLDDASIGYPSPHVVRQKSSATESICDTNTNNIDNVEVVEFVAYYKRFSQTKFSNRRQR
jgi:hypothetical protein